MHDKEGALKGPDVIRCLRHLLRKVAGKLLVVWDSSPIHRSKAVKEFLAEGAAERLQLERLPGYAPELKSRLRRLETSEVRGAEAHPLPEPSAATL